MVNRFKANAIALIEGTSSISDSSESNDDSEEVESYEKIFIGMIKEIAKFYSSEVDEGLSQNKKLKLTSGLWLAMSQKILFKKHSSAAHALSKKLKEKRIVAGSSVLYPKNIKFLSSNPLTNCFVHSDFSSYDDVLDYRDKLISELLDLDILSEEFILRVWIYLRIFHLEQIPKKYLKYIRKENYFVLDNKRLFIFPIEKIEEYQPIEIYMLDENMSLAFDRAYGDDTQMEKDCIFSEKPEEYEVKMQKILSRSLPGVSFSQIRKLAQLEYQLHHTPLSLTLRLSKKHPKISVLEIKKMYPDFDAPKLLEIEKNNIEAYRNLDIKMDETEEEEEAPLQRHLLENLEVYDHLKGVVNTPLETKAFSKYLKEWQTFIDKHTKKEEGFLLKILEFSRILLDKADPSISNKPIKPKTLKEYLRISFQYAFKHIVAEGDINEEVIKSIEESIIYNDSLTLASQRKYKRVINIFLKNMTNYKSLRQIESVIHVRRSVVFKDELDALVLKLIEKDRGDIQKLTDKNFVITYKNVVFALLLYYSGCRKNELRSRLVRDMVAIPANDFSIDINKEGINKLKKVEGDKDQSLKTFSAKRRVRFTVSDEKYFKIIKRYLSIVEKNCYNFLFPQHNKRTNKIYKNKVISESSLDHIGMLLQVITQRYTPLHSLRHSYATNQLKYIYESNHYRVEDIFEISNQIGHSDPSVTMNYYMHIDLLRLKNILN